MLNQILPQNSTARNGQPSVKATAKQIEIAAALDDLHAHGDDTAAALALGDLWLTLPPPDRALVIDPLKELAGAANPEPVSQRMLLAFQQTLTAIFGG